jgi:hypothetical protein
MFCITSASHELLSYCSSSIPPLHFAGQSYLKPRSVRQSVRRPYRYRAPPKAYVINSRPSKLSGKNLSSKSLACIFMQPSRMLNPCISGLSKLSVCLSSSSSAPSLVRSSCSFHALPYSEAPQVGLDCACFLGHGSTLKSMAAATALQIPDVLHNVPATSQPSHFSVSRLFSVPLVMVGR